METVTISTQPIHSHASHDGHCSCDGTGAEHSHDDEPLAVTDVHQGRKELTRACLEEALSRLSKETVWRVKGFVRVDGEEFILNWAFGRYDIIPLPQDGSRAAAPSGQVKLTVMGERGEVKRAARKFSDALDATVG